MILSQVAKLTGLEPELLRRMRSRESVTLRSGPPFCKTIDEEGNTVYEYDRGAVKDWLKRRNCRITAGDAARILGISRAELLAKFSGQHSFEGAHGKLIINTTKNIYIWIPKISLKRYDTKKRKRHLRRVK